jgi:hypothetical protein
MNDTQTSCLAETDPIERVRVRLLPDGRMTRDDAARYLGHASKTLAMWALQGKGPRSVKVGGRVFYYRADLDAFVAGRVA